MKQYFHLIILVCSFIAACTKHNDKPAPAQSYSTSITTPAGEQGYLYIDGKYSGLQVPGSVLLPAGQHTIGIALKSSRIYLKKQLTVSAKSNLGFTMSDKPAAKTWKALWIGLQETKGASASGDCSTHFSTTDLDAACNFFTWSLQEHFEQFSYGTMKWETERKDITVPVALTKSSIGYTVEPAAITALLPQIQPGTYDCVFVFWRESEGACSFPGNYFGLAWTNPMSDPFKTGYVTVKFDPGASIADKINYYKTTDPGVWVHEWLHTVGENFYQDKGLSLPEKSGGFAVHAAEMYHYTFPWMDWYRDFISGRVPNSGGSPAYMGIGPEGLLKCTVREMAVNGCN